MLVEVNCNGKTHSEHAKGKPGQPCRASDTTFGNYCLNCGWRLDHAQERGAEIVIHWHHQDHDGTGTEMM